MKLRDLRIERTWTPRGLAGGRDHDDTKPPFTFFRSTDQRQLRRYADIDHFPCLVLLGEPGIGKSTAMGRAYEDERNRGDALVIWKNLGVFSDTGHMQREIFRSSDMATWKAGDSHLSLFLDALDESVIHVKPVFAALSEEFTTLKPLAGRLRLRVACRTAEWPTLLESSLTDVFGDGVGIFELTPLQIQDVMTAAEAWGVEVRRFLDAVKSRDAMAIATRPLTLEFLLNRFSRTSTLPSSRQELFSEGCRLLAGESSESRRASDDLGSGTLSADERLAVASRIAALTVFSGGTGIWTGQDEPDIPSSDLRIRDFASGVEACGVDMVHVGQRELRETLKTALFSALDRAGRLRWSHRSYADFLAARYLVEHHLELPQILSLLTHSDDDHGKLVPQLYEASAWLADMRPDVFSAIASIDPGVLLRSDLQAGSAERRADLTAALLKRFSSHEIVDWNWELRIHFGKLRHGSIAEQLRPYLTASRGTEAGQLASVRIARECECSELSDELATLALDEGVDEQVRIEAAIAIAEFGMPDDRRRLRPLATGDLEGDADLELKGYALQATWPGYLTADELFGSFTRVDLHLIGGYARFMYSDPITHLQPADLPTALEGVMDFR